MLNYYKNHSCLGNKYVSCKHICSVKLAKSTKACAVKARRIDKNHQIAHPIYLPLLSTSPESVKTVGGNQDVILTIPGLAGFQMKVKANSVTFPDGSRVGTLVVSPVTADKLPMAPPAGGAQFGVPAWTVQPAGTRFDPPIEVTLPNASSQPAGDNLPIVQWDHDLGQYVAMGRATVSEDGSVLITDSGSGITKAGWGGLCRYDPDKCTLPAPPAPKCNDCQKLEAGSSSGDCPPSAGNCVALPKLGTVNSGKCCGGNIIDTDKYCCLKIPTTELVTSFEKGKPIFQTGNFPPASYPGYPNLQQFKGPPAGPNDPFNRTEPDGITYSIDGCSTPDTLGFMLFPPGLFIRSANEASSNPMAKGFYNACSKHDICYQTCGKQQGTCDSKLYEDLKQSCVAMPNDDAFEYRLFGQMLTPISTQQVCMESALKMYTALQGAGFAAYNTRQKQMCVGCAK